MECRHFGIILLVVITQLYEKRHFMIILLVLTIQLREYLLDHEILQGAIIPSLDIMQIRVLDLSPTPPPSEQTLLSMLPIKSDSVTLLSLSSNLKLLSRRLQMSDGSMASKVSDLVSTSSMVSDQSSISVMGIPVERKNMDS